MVLFAISAVFLILAIRNSLFNVFEILDKLDSGIYSDEEISANYIALSEEWGEMIVADMGSAKIKFINIKKAFSNGASTTYSVLAIITFVLALLLGKLIFPAISRSYTDANTQMADLAAIKTQEIISKKKSKEWF